MADSATKAEADSSRSSSLALMVALVPMKMEGSFLGTAIARGIVSKYLHRFLYKL